MNQMILKVPVGFNAVAFCNIASAMVRDAATDEDRRNYDYNLGDLLRKHFVAGDKVFSMGNNDYYVPFGYYNARRDCDLYEVDANFVDFELVGALDKLCNLCPQVEFYFENCGDGENEENVYDREYFNNAMYELMRN